MEEKTVFLLPEHTASAPIAIEEEYQGTVLPTIPSENFTEGTTQVEPSREFAENLGLFTVRTANQWMESAQSKPIPRMLFGELWFEGELCILFSDTNLGKSALAVQIANSISKGEAILGLALEALRQPVLYCDFELSEKQFEIRYSAAECQNHYVFDDNLRRVEINPDSAIPEGSSFEDFLNESLEKVIKATGAKVVIVDNITYLRSGTEKANDALPLMKQLKNLKSKYDLSMLVLAHTPKRNLMNPISKNDLQGSKMLINFCDSCFAIGESSTDAGLRYLKQIKQRNCEQIYGQDNVCVCQIDKPTNFLQFDFVRFGTEREHLRQLSETDADEEIEQVMALHHQGRSYRQIATELGISHMRASRIISKHSPQ